MPYIAPEVIARAKQIDLLTYLQRCEPDELTHAGGREYSTKTHGSLKISNGLWCWNARGIGGKTALDFLIKVRGMNFPDAVEHLAGMAAEPSFFVPEAQGQRPKKLLLPEKNIDCARVQKYLAGRGIAPTVIDFCVRTGRLFESAGYHNAVFVGFDVSGLPRYAALRGTNSDFKGEADGSDKRYSFSLPAETGGGSLHVFESAIDALSYATLTEQKGLNWRGQNLLSLAGVFLPADGKPSKRLPAALSRFLTDYPHIKKIALHLDNDLAGRLASASILDALPEQYSALAAPPPRGKDVNEYLKIKLGLVKADSERGDVR